MEIITEFQKLATANRVSRRGRPATLTPEQREHRAEVQKVKNRLRNEARRRAYVVLQNRYQDEFETLLDQELQALKTDDRYRIPSEDEFTGSQSSVQTGGSLTI